MEHKDKRSPDFVRFLQIHLTEHCNLNCKGCTHFSPLAKEKYLGLDELDGMLDNIEPFLDKWFKRLELLGGEPLLHPDIEKIIELTRKHFKTTEVRLVTNGVKLPAMPESFFDTIRDNSIVIAISRYPLDLDYEVIEKKLEEKSIPLKYYGEYTDRKTFRQYRLNPNGTYDSKTSYSKCKFAGHCLQLKGNRIYPCFIPAYANYLNEYFGTGFTWESGDYIELDHTIDYREFMSIAAEPVPFCRYCNMEDQTEFEWEPSRKDPAEWLETI